MSEPQCRKARTARLPGPARHMEDQLGSCGDFISIELQEACKLSVDVPVSLRAVVTGPGDMQVLAWLRLHQDEIIEAEETWCVDRLAIAGAIAWEALMHNRHFRMRSVGVGKIHFIEMGKIPVIEEVEQAGYLPFGPVSDEKQREAILLTDRGSIQYIAAIMRAQADAVTYEGKYPDEHTYWNPPVLATWFNSVNLAPLIERYSKKGYPDPLQPGPPMGTWVAARLRYLEAAVGRLPEDCRPTRVDPLPGTKIAEEVEKRKRSEEYWKRQEEEAEKRWHTRNWHYQ